MISILVLSGLFWQAGTMEQLTHCFCALEQITQVVWEQLRRTMQMKAFRLNKYENYGKVLSLVPSAVPSCTGPWIAFRTKILIDELWKKTSVAFHLLNTLNQSNLYSLYSHAYFTQPQTLVRIRFLFTSDQLTQHKAHALSAKVFHLETRSKTQIKWV